LNSDQSPLAQARHHAARRRAARSLSSFCPGRTSKSSDQKLVDRRGTNDQTLVKLIHAIFRWIMTVRRSCDRHS